jgi:hypothetical protein
LVAEELDRPQLQQKDQTAVILYLVQSLLLAVAVVLLQSLLMVLTVVLVAVDGVLVAGVPRVATEEAETLQAPLPLKATMVAMGRLVEIAKLVVAAVLERLETRMPKVMAVMGLHQALLGHL